MQGKISKTTFQPAVLLPNLTLLADYFVPQVRSVTMCSIMQLIIIIKIISRTDKNE